MPDLDKVIREIKSCTSGGYPCENCSHYGHGEDLVGCMDELLSDALELLKEQETHWMYYGKTNGRKKERAKNARCSRRYLTECMRWHNNFGWVVKRDV